MREIYCNERDAFVIPALEQGLLTVYSGSTNHMGNGVVTTVWGLKGDKEVEILYEETVYAPETWPNRDGITECSHILTPEGLEFYERFRFGQEA